MDVERRWRWLRGQKTFDVLIEWDRALSKIRDPRISSPLGLRLYFNRVHTGIRLIY